MNAAGTAAIREPGTGSTDATLVDAVRAGDDGAFEELYRRYRQPVGAFVRRQVRDDGRAEDVTQEAFVSALRRLRQTESEIAFRPWIYEIARNASIDLYRRTSRAQEVSIDVEGGLPPADVRRLSGGPGPQAALLGKERFDSLRGALDELSEQHHRIIVMRELEGLSYREIGDRMELSPTAVESMLFRARRKLEHEYVQIDSGRRCRLIGAMIGRLAEGMESDRDRRRLDRHARRCSGCRRRARELGVEPLLVRRGLAARAAALLPLPVFARRRSGDDAAGTGGSGVQHTLASVGAAVGPGIETAAAGAGKAVAVVVAAAAIGGGGATLGGVGPLAVDPGGKIEQIERPATGAAGVLDMVGAVTRSRPRLAPAVAARPFTAAPSPEPAPSDPAADRSDARSESAPQIETLSLPVAPRLPRLELPRPPAAAPLELRSAPEGGDPAAPEQPGAPADAGLPASPVTPPAASPPGSGSTGEPGSSDSDSSEQSAQSGSGSSDESAQASQPGPSLAGATSGESEGKSSDTSSEESSSGTSGSAGSAESSDASGAG